VPNVALFGQISKPLFAITDPKLTSVPARNNPIVQLIISTSLMLEMQANTVSSKTELLGGFEDQS
jgi:hypothetical protein